MPAQTSEQLPRRRIPQPERAVVGSGQDARSIGREGDGIDRAVMALEGPEQLPGRGIPEANRVILPTGEGEFAVGG